MTHRAKSFIVCVIGLPITFLGWNYDTRILVIGTVISVIAFLAELKKPQEVEVDPN